MNGIAEEAVGTLHVLEDSTHASSSCKAEVPDGEHAAHAPPPPPRTQPPRPYPGQPTHLHPMHRQSPSMRMR